MFMVYLTLLFSCADKEPREPLGFGRDAIATTNVQLLFMAILFGGTTIGSGFLLNRVVGNVRLAAIGAAISSIGFFSLSAFHSSAFAVAATLTVINLCGAVIFNSGRL